MEVFIFALAILCILFGGAEVIECIRDDIKRKR